MNLAYPLLHHLRCFHMLLVLLLHARFALPRCSRWEGLHRGKPLVSDCLNLSLHNTVSMSQLLMLLLILQLLL